MPDTVDVAIRTAPLPLFRSRDIGHVDRGVRRGELVPVCRGVYASAAEWALLPPWDKYLARVHAVAMIRPGALFALESAAALQGLPVFRDPGPVHVISNDTSTSRLTGAVLLHSAAVPRETVRRGGMLMTTAAETTVDLARHRHEVVGLSAADAALRLDPRLTVEVLVALNESRASSRGRRRARWALNRSDGKAESTLESVSRAAIEWLGFPEPVLQRSFATSEDVRDRSDFWWPDQRTVGEADGDIKYDGTHGDPLERLRARRERDARLRSWARSITHWAWSDVSDPDQLGSILDGVHLPRVRPEDGERLHSLRRLLARR
ncbi:hypothetical protein [Microbacterium aureliae]